jgi:DNA integrity scanning protein DisA with diadenylate cyclase activity
MTALEIDLIVVATVTPDTPTPATACHVQHQLGAANAVAFDISAACSGFLYAMKICKRLISDGAFNNALIIGAEKLLIDRVKEILPEDDDYKYELAHSGFEAGTIDSVSVLRLEEHLGQLTSRDLRNLETKVPLETLKIVVDLAVEIGREGREGKPVGTLFVVGDTRKVMQSSHATGFDPVRGYSRTERKLTDPRVREGIKEIAQLDGAFVVGPDGTVEGAARYIDASAESVSVAKGLGARHWAAAAITRRTRSVAVAVSETNGTVRLFQNGEVVLRIEPFRRAMKWKDFEYEPPSAD